MAILTSLQNAEKWLQLAIQEALATTSVDQSLEQISPASSSNQESSQRNQSLIAYGSKVSPEFKRRVIWIGQALGCDPNYLMACMAWEDAETFASGTKNAAGSGAVGLIQFMPRTAAALGTSTAELEGMTPEDQLEYVYKYFRPYAGRLHNLGDVYMVILWPAAVGKEDSFTLFDRSKAPTAYRENAGLDANKDGLVTRGECLVKIEEKLKKGLEEGLIG